MDGKQIISKKITWDEDRNFRFKAFFEFKNLSQEEFSSKMNYPQPNLNAILNNKRALGEKIIINNLLPNFPELNKIWLIDGVGEMLNDIHDIDYQIPKSKEKKESPFEELPIEVKLNVLYELCKDKLANEDETEDQDIKKINRTIHGLVSKDAHQDKYIDFLRDKIAELENSLKDQKELTVQILEIVKNLKVTSH